MEVVALVKDKPIQLFIATHSLEVIANFTALIQEGKIEREDLMAFRVGLQEGKLSSSWFNADNLTAWLEEGLIGACGAISNRLCNSVSARKESNDDPPFLCRRKN